MYFSAPCSKPPAMVSYDGYRFPAAPTWSRIKLFPSLTMPKRNIEDLIATLGRLKDAQPADSTLSALRKGLADRVNLVVAKAAQVAADMQLKPLIPDLVSTFDRLLAKGAESDPQCWGKNADRKSVV